MPKVINYEQATKVQQIIKRNLELAPNETEKNRMSLLD